MSTDREIMEQHKTKRNNFRESGRSSNIDSYRASRSTRGTEKSSEQQLCTRIGERNERQCRRSRREAAATHARTLLCITADGMGPNDSAQRGSFGVEACIRAGAE